MASKKIPYIHKTTGEVVIVTKQSAKKLSKDYERVEFTTNEEGKRVMRLQLKDATVDISENEQEMEQTDGIGSTE